MDSDKQPDDPARLTPEQRLEKERTALLIDLADARLSTLMSKVAWTLNHFPTLVIPMSRCSFATGSNLRKTCTMGAL